MDPCKPLRRIGWVAVGLGVLDLLRFLRPTDALILDLPAVFASFLCGWALLRRKSIALLAASTAGGVILADALVSMVLVGPLQWQVFTEKSVFAPALLSGVCRLLLYGFQAIFWPYAAARVMKDQEGAGIPRAYAIHSRSTVIASFFVCGWMSLVVQLWAKVIVFRLV
jgi:hypothetical protein